MPAHHVEAVEVDGEPVASRIPLGPGPHDRAPDSDGARRPKTGARRTVRGVPARIAFVIVKVRNARRFRDFR